MKIHNNINIFMAKNKIGSVQELARLMGVSKVNLWRFYDNELKTINKELAIKVCQYFDCSFGELFEIVTDEEYEKRNIGLIERKARLRNGWIYFLKNESNQLTKIGRTSHLDTRLENLRAEYKTQLNLLTTIETDDAINLEIKIHKMFKEKRVTGEWFKLTEKDIGEIKDKFLS